MNWQQLMSSKHFASAGPDGEAAVRDDYDTIICSTLFRRLQDKAQVFPLDNDDYVRTRLTHSLEVSAIGKRLGAQVFSMLREAEKDGWFERHTEKSFADVLLCAGLVHDIGNPPFGHFGEYAIREWFQNDLEGMRLGGEKVSGILTEWQREDLLHFEGNAQSLRLLSKTPYLGSRAGFNLSYAVLGSILKYPVSSADLKRRNPRGYKKMGYNYAERELFWDMDAVMGLNGCRHPLSYLLEAADDIAYRTSDLEDAMVKKVVTLQQILEEFDQQRITLDAADTPAGRAAIRHMDKLEELYREEKLNHRRKAELTAVQRWNQYLQGVMVQDAARSFVKHYEELMQGELQGDLFDDTASGYLIEIISVISEKYVYSSSIKTMPELFGRRVIHSLLDQFMPAAILYDTEEQSTFIDRRTIDTVSDFYKSMYRSESVGKSAGDRLYLRMLMITDYISGMTDNYAKRLYQDLYV